MICYIEKSVYLFYDFLFHFKIKEETWKANGEKNGKRFSKEI